MKPIIVILLFAFALSAAERRYTDPQGKTWIYRTTPFGVARYEEAPAPPPAPMPGARAFDDGDYVRFERPGPFGTYHWRTKKADLDETEKALWAAARQRRD